MTASIWDPSSPGISPGSDAVDISYVSAGANAVPTNVRAKLRERVSLEDYGVTPASTDAEVSAAIAKAFTDANILEINTAGTWNYDTAISIVGKSIIGRGSRDIILHYTGADVALTVGGTDNEAPTIRGFKLTGTANATGGLRLKAAGTGCRRGLFTDLQVTGFTKVGVYGIDLAASANNGIYYNDFIGVRGDGNYSGWRLYSSDGAANGNRCNANNFLGCTAQFNTSDGVFIDYATGNTLTGFDREANGGFGINQDHAHTIITGGYSETNVSGWLKKTANGICEVFGGHIVDSATYSIAYALGDKILVDTTALNIRQDGGIGMGGASAIRNSINFSNALDAALMLSGANYLILDHTNGLMQAFKAMRENVTVAASVAGALDLSAVRTGIVEVTVTENITAITMPPLIEGRPLKLVFKQTGAFTVGGWPGTVGLAGGAFVLTAAAGKYDTLTFFASASFNKWLEHNRAQNQ